jgi:hypothetical protein
MAKPESNFVYYVTEKGARINCGNVSEWNVGHVTYESVQYLRKSTHVHEKGSIVNEYNVLFYN